MADVTKVVDALRRWTCDGCEPDGPACGKCEAAYQAIAMLREMGDALGMVGRMLAANGCDCDCDHCEEDHDDECERCLACRISLVVSDVPEVRNG